MAFESKNKLNLPPVHVNVPENTPLYVHVVKTEAKSSKQQASKKVLQKVVVCSPRKEPWVPPPAKTKRRMKTVSTKVMQESADVDEDYPEELSETRLQDDSSQISIEDKGDASGSYVSDLNGVKRMDYEFGSGDNQRSNINYQEIGSLVKEFELMEHHSSSLQSLVQFLLRKIPKMLFVDGEPLRNLASSADRLVKELVMSIDVLKGQLNPSGSNLDSAFSAVHNFLVSKLLESYECIGVMLQLVLENQDKIGISTLCSEQESLRKTVETMQNDFLAREARIQDLENQLAVSQAQVNTLKMSKNTLEDTRSHLLKELANKESQLEILDAKLKKLLFSGSTHKENDRLIEVMEEIHQRSEAEKEALKKSVKFQKTRAEQNEEIISRLQAKLQEKEDLVYNIAGERDEWKVKMTVTTNQLTELESQVSGLKRQSEKLQLLLDEGESSHQEELSKLSKTLEEKSTLLEQLSKQNTDMKSTLKSLENRCTETETELQSFQKIYSDVVSAINPQHSEAFSENEPVKVEALVNAVHEVKEQLMTLQRMNEQLKDEKKSDAPEGTPFDADVGLLSLIQEMKEELQILKQTFHQVAADKEKGEQIAHLTEQVNTLKEKYTLAAEENQKLMAQMERLERRVPTSVGLFEERNEINKVQATVKEHSHEADQLYNKLVQNSEEFQKQIKELRDQLFRQEQFSNIKILKMEDELHARKLEINSLESRNREEDEKRMRRIKELQDHLDEASADNQSLQKYVQFLKSSYFNVFGKL